MIYRKNGGLAQVEIPSIIDMTAGFVIPKKYENCEINVYVWDRNMKAYDRSENGQIEMNFDGCEYNYRHPLIFSKFVTTKVSIYAYFKV